MKLIKIKDKYYKKISVKESTCTDCHFYSIEGDCAHPGFDDGTTGCIDYGNPAIYKEFNLVEKLKNL